MRFRNQLLALLIDRTDGSILPNLRLVQLRPDRIIAEDGVVPDEVCFPESAVLSCLKVMSDGKVTEVGAVGKEGAAGLLPCLAESGTTARIAVKIGGAATMLWSSVLRTAAWKDDVLRAALLAAAAVEARDTAQAAACNALHPAGCRLARWLLNTQDRTGSDRFPLTQDYMALMLGLQRPTANGIALGLKQAGAIHYSRGVVHIRDRPALMAAACECYDAGDTMETGDGVAEMERRRAGYTAKLQPEVCLPVAVYTSSAEQTGAGEYPAI